MGDVVNLKQIRKRNERVEKAAKAETNRARFGRTKTEKQNDELALQRANVMLDQHRIDGENAT